jgi:hypothetical protein
MRPRVIRLLGAFAPSTDDGIIVGAANALAAEVLRKFRLFMVTSVSKWLFDSRKKTKICENIGYFETFHIG